MLLPKKRRLRLTRQEYLEQRQRVFENAGWRCERCGKIAPLQRDHIRKRSRLGGDETENAQALCPRCHEEKDNVAKSKSRYWR